MSQVASSDSSRYQLWGSFAAVFLLVTSIYLLTARTEFSSIDEVYVFRTAEALAQRQSLEIEETGGRTSSRFSLLPSVIVVPGYWLADQWLGDVAERDAWKLYFARTGSLLAIAVSVLFLLAWLRELGHTLGIAALTVLLYAFGTMVFPYSSTFYVQVVTVALLLAAVWSVASGRTWSSAVAVALLVACRNDQLLLLFPFWVAVRTDGFPRPWRRAIVLTLAAVIGASASALTSWSRGDPLLHGPYGGETFTTALTIGLLGLLFSFGKGLTWYSPLSMFGLVASLPEAWRRPQPGRLVLYVLGTEILLISHWWTWHGGITWGPRLLLPILPLCMLPVASFLSSWSSHLPLYRRLFLLLALASLLINGWAAWQPMDRDPAAVYSELEAFYTPNASPLLAGSMQSSAWLFRAPEGNLRLGVQVVLGALVLVSIGGLLAIFRPRWRWDRKPAYYWVAIILFITAAKWPAMLRFASDSASPHPVSQYRQMEQTRDGFRGTLRIPVAGYYFFHQDGQTPLTVTIGADRLFQGAPVTSLRLSRGDLPIEIVGDRPLRWSVPGFGSYNEPIPSDYLMSPAPTPLQRLQVQWRHLGWIFWIPAFILLCQWLLWDRTVPGASGPIQSTPDSLQQGPAT